MFVPVELHCHSAFSFLDGASHPVEIASKAHDLGYETYRDLLTAQRGDRGPEERATATDSGRIDSCRALDPATTSTRS